MFPYLKSQIICLGVPPIQPGDKVASRSPKGRLGDPEGPGLYLPRFARHLGGGVPSRHRPPHSPWRGTGCPELGDRGYSGGGSSCSSSSSAARPRLHTLRPQRAPPPPPPAPTVPQQQPRAPRLARPRPTRPARSRCTAAFSGSLRARTALFAPGIGRRARARALPATRTTFGLRALSLFYPLSFPLWRRGTGWRRVTRPSVSHAAIGPASWRK